MDKRKAYAIVHPVARGAMIRDGHRARVDKRFATVLYCDGEEWVCRIERVASSLRVGELLDRLPPDIVAHMRALAERILRDADCGDGAVTVKAISLTMIEARRPMMPSEQAALIWPPAQAS